MHGQAGPSLLVGAVLLAAAMLWVAWWRWGADDAPAPGAAPAASSPQAAPQVISPLPPPPSPDSARAGGASTSAGAFTAAALRAGYRDRPAQMEQRLRDRRVTLRGRLQTVERADSGVMLAVLDAGDLPALTVLIASAHHAEAQAWPLGADVSLECLHGGTIMGEPVFKDCRPSRG